MGTVNPEIFARILFSGIALKDIFAISGGFYLHETKTLAKISEFTVYKS